MIWGSDILVCHHGRRYYGLLKQLPKHVQGSYIMQNQPQIILQTTCVKTCTSNYYKHLSHTSRVLVEEKTSIFKAPTSLEKTGG